jgi:hypothetical protein
MRIRNTIIALVLLAIVGGYALIVSRYSKPEEEAQKLLTVRTTDIAKIELRYSDRDIVVERSKGGGWRIVKPIGTDADQTTCNNLAGAIAGATVTKTVEEKTANLAPFGLDKPATVVTVTTFDGKTLPGIEVGKTTPVGFSAYVKLADKPAVMLTSSAFPPGMNKTVDQLRNRELMSFKVDEVTKLVLTRDNGQMIEVDRDGDNWKIVKPSPYLADATQVRQILSTLDNTKIADFISDAPGNVAQYGLEKPHLVATVYFGKNAATQSLLFGFKQSEEGKDGIYVRRGERAPVYTVHEFVMGQVDKDLLALRDKSILNLKPADIAGIDVKRASGAYTLKRDAKGKWSVIEGGKTSPAETPVVERFVYELQELKAASIIADPMPSLAPFGMDHPTIEIAVSAADGKQLAELKLAKLMVKPAASPGEPPGEPEPEYYATASTSKAVYSLNDFIYGLLDKTAEQFLGKGEPAASASPAGK